MSGIVWEWCEDCYDDKLFAVLRGCSWNTDPNHCEIFRRMRDPFQEQHSCNGFRLALD